ncbi:MAG: hypothetical protein GY816_11225 [Cytophagales bacterium]|nr:hypothetical protein [Cytophagales bacterium]
MKKITLLLTMAALALSPAQAQERMTENDIVGSWKMIIDLDQVIEEIEEEADESETLLAQVILESVSGIVEGVMDNIDIYMDFERGGDLTILAEAFDDIDDEEESEWYIKYNRLYIEDVDSFDSDDDDYWVLKDGVLYLEGDDDDDVTIYMIRVDD